MALKKIRNDQKLSRRDVIFALEKEGVSITENTLSSWENGKYDPSISGVMALSKIYGVGVEKLCKK